MWRRCLVGNGSPPNSTHLSALRSRFSSAPCRVSWIMASGTAYNVVSLSVSISCDRLAGTRV